MPLPARPELAPRHRQVPSSEPVRGDGHMAPLSRAGIPPRGHWRPRQTAAPAALRSCPADRARRRGEPGEAGNKGEERARGPRGHRGERGGRGGGRRAGGVPRPSKPPFFPRSRKPAPGDPGGGAARRPRRPVRALPPSAANPTPRSAQRAAGRRAHTSRRGGAAGGAGARSAVPALKGPSAPRAHRACPTAGRGGTGQRRAHARAARRNHGWRPRGGGAALVHVSAPAGSRPARGACAGPPRRAFRRSRAAGQARPPLRRVFGWPGRSFRASWTKCCPRGTELQARARGERCGRAYAFVSPALPRRWATRARSHFARARIRTSSPAFRARGLGPPFWAHNRPFSQWHRGL